MNKEPNVQNVEIFPKFLIILFFTEMWERFSYYGMRALLVIFLTSHLGYTDPQAYAIYSLFAALCYATPVIGGIIADRLVGFRNMVIIGGIIITLGHIFLAFINFNSQLVYLGLALIAVGSGMFKGNITNLLGVCYHGYSPEERTRGFTLFYVSFNIGSFIASIACGYIARLYGWHYGFGVAGIGMVLGLLVFLRFQYLFGQEGLSPKAELMQQKFLGMNIITILIIANLLAALVVAKMLMFSEFFSNILVIFGIGTLLAFNYILIKLPIEQRRNLIALSIITAFFMLFFALEMQLGSLIALFIERNVNNKILGITVPASVFQAINPLSIILLGIACSKFKIAKKYATVVFTFGLLTMAICFFLLYIGCLSSIDGKVEVSYLIIAISFIGLGEVCIGPLVQEQTTQLAPPHLRGIVMGMLMLSLAFSNLVGIVIAKFMSVPSINGEVDCLQSLEIYKAGFLNIAMFNLGFVALFLLFYRFVNRIIINADLPRDNV